MLSQQRNMTADHKIVIVGSGAVGCYFGGRLAQAGNDVTFLMRSDFDHVASHGLQVSSVDGDFHLTSPQIARDLGHFGTADLVIIAWKTTSNDQLETVLKPIVSERTRILTLQNGLGSVEQLAALYPDNEILAGICFICSIRSAPGVIEHTAGGRIQIGSPSPTETSSPAEIAALFRESGVDAKAVDDLDYAQWAKLVWNVPFNGLAIAKGGVTTDRLLANPKWEIEVRELMAEVIAGAAALGITIDSAFIAIQIERTCGMGAYRPSSMIDYVEKRPVEIESIWQEPYHRATAAGAHLPRWKELITQITARCT